MLYNIYKPIKIIAEITEAKMEKKWKVTQYQDNNKVSQIIDEMKINRFIASIMIKRGITDPKEISKFLEPKLKHLHSPKNMMDMDKGTDIIIEAIKKGKKIVIYGDYDCDGVTSTTIMYRGLLRCRAEVSYHIPDRIEEGYGMNSETIEKLYSEGCQVILTCDNGISCIEQVKLAKSLGIEIVVTDHHEVPFTLDEDGNKLDMLPEADAVINPKRMDCKYPFKSLCGAGVAFKFIHTLYVKLGIDSKELYELIELASIGTVCDVVDLVDENRIIVSMGLKMINGTKNIGLRALIKEIGFEGKQIRAGNIGFQIGPCINATGRLDNASLSVELLLCEDPLKAADLAKELRSLNQERQAMTDESLEKIIEQIEGSELKNDRVLVVYKEDLHESLAGILAGRIRERYNKPAYIITKAKDRAKGSGRSIDEYDMFQEISKCKDILLGAGGHPMAAGFSLEEEKIPLFRERLNKQCTLTQEDLAYKINIDDRLELSDISFDLIHDLERLEPFGKGNSEPKFMLQGAVIDRVFFMGKNQEHLKLFCRDASSNLIIQGVKFYEADLFKDMLSNIYGEDRVEMLVQNPGTVNLKMDLLFKPSVNEWNNVKTIQMQILDYRICE